MEGLPQTGPDKKPEDPDKKKKGTQKGTSVRFPGFAEVATGKDAEQAPAPKESTREKLLESLGLRKDEPEEQPNAEADSDKGTETAATAATESAEITAADSVAETTGKPKKPEEEPLSSQELAPNELSGGEVIIHLTGDESLAERVIPLHEEDAAIASAEEPADPDAEMVDVDPVESAAYDEEPNEPEQPQAVHEQAEPAVDGGDLPPVPPRPPAYIPPPVTPLPPQPEQYEAVGTPYIPPAVAAGERFATKKEVQDAARAAKKTRKERGVLAGLLVAAGYEHRKQKRRIKKLERQLKKQNKEFGSDRKDRHFYFEEQQKQQGKNEQRFANIENKAEKAAVPKPPYAENPEQLQVPEGHHIETSAWHSIEVDSKTGKAVENPAFAYGNEYYRERAKESAPTLHRNTAAGEVALVAAAAQADHVSSATTPTAIPLATTQGSPSRRKNIMLSGSLKTTSSTQAGPLWPWLIALAVIVVCLALVLH